MSDPTPKPVNLPKPPFWAISFVVIAITASWIPLALIAKARTTPSVKPRIHIFQDMDVQPKLKPQGFEPTLFADHRAMRPQVEGTVARTQLQLDDHYYRGYATDGNLTPIEDGGQPKWFEGLPEQVKLDRALLMRGKERFNIFCSPCHGLAGEGDGMVARRAKQLAETISPKLTEGWVAPFNLHQKDPNSGNLVYGQPIYPAGKLYNTIAHGARSMPGYGSQIDVADRWAIVAYVHALQFAYNVPKDQIPSTIDLSQIAEAMQPKEEPAAPAEDIDLSDPAMIAEGKQLFQANACFSCHKTPDFPPMPTHAQAPNFEGGIFGHQVTVTLGVGGDKKKVTVDQAYFRESVKNPLAKIVVNDQTGQAFQPIMPPLPLTDQQINSLMAYVHSLGSVEGGHAEPAKPEAETKPEAKPEADAKPMPKAEAQPAAGGDAVTRGKNLFQSMACFTCHKTPDFPDMPTHAQAPSYVGGILGHDVEVTIGIGGPRKKVTIDEDYIRESIQNPLAKIAVDEKNGQAFQPIMPPLPVTDAQMDDLVAYIRSLGTAEPKAEHAEAKAPPKAEPKAAAPQAKPMPKSEAAEHAAAAPKLDPEAVARGKQLFQTNACFSCHKTPDFPDMPTHAQAPSYVGGIIGHKVEVTVGVGGPKKTITVDEDYIRESVKNPMAKIVVNEKTGQAYMPIMPPLPVTDAQIDDIIAYIKSLGVHTE